MLKAVKRVMKEHIDNMHLIGKLTVVNMTKQTIRTSLGVWWLYIHDFTYFGVFMLFRILMAGNGDIDGIHNVVYLVTGLVPWFYVSEVMNVGANSIKQNRAIILSIKFPITILPTIEVISIFVKRIVMFAFAFLVTIYFGYLRQIHFILFLYYVICMVVFMLVFTQLISAFVAVSCDFHQFYIAVVRVLMYTMPIVWGFKHISKIPFLSIIVRINPMVYFINGFRNAFVLGRMPDLGYTIYFWGAVVLLFLAACYVQDKLKKYYADFV